MRQSLDVKRGNPVRAPESATSRSSTDGMRGNGNQQSAERNRLIRLLPAEEYAWLQPHFKTVNLNVGDLLADEDEPFRHVYFMETGVASVVNRVSGGTVEVGTIGNEGMAGLAVFLDGGIAASRTFIQVPGDAKRVPADVFAAGIDSRPHLRRILNRYTQAFITLVSQTAACNSAHQLEERCARWLLMTHDRVDGADTFPLTHEFLSFMLGVRRAGVTVAAGMLQKAGFITYKRGKITVLDRAGLESASCECYGIVKSHFDRLLG
ncbi:MAG: Crp/Fnr family transcriptional regulator [Gemmatimonadales bacterium]